MAFQSLPAAVQDILQQNYLERKFQQNLKAKNVFWRTSFKLPVEKRSGEVTIYSRNGHIYTNYDDINPSINTNLDNGATVNGVGGNGDISFEQWRVTIGMFQKYIDINMIANEETIANLYKKYVEELSYWAALGMDLKMAQCAFQAYLSGQSFVTAATTGSATAHLDNVIGLNTVFQAITLNGRPAVTGEPVAVSLANPIMVTILPISGAASYQAQITGVVLDAPSGLASDPLNQSIMQKYGLSGTVTFSANQTLAIGDAVVAIDAPVLFRPNGRTSTYSLTPADTIGAQLIIDAVAELRANGVMPPLMDGTYPCYIDPIVDAQFFTDPQYQIMSQTQVESKDFKEARIARNFGVTFVPTTNCPSFTFTNADGVQLVARHAIVTGEQYLQDSPFSGVKDALKTLQDMSEGVADYRFIDDFVFVTRMPLDRAGQILSLGAYRIGGQVAPTDATINSDGIPSASNKRYKRAVAVQVAAAR